MKKFYTTLSILFIVMLVLVVNVKATNKYWVGGNGNWDASNTVNWSLTSGGYGGESVPTSSDDVFFDANSAGGSVVISSSNYCKNLICTNGFLGDLAGTQSLHVFGNFTLGTNMTFSFSGAISFLATSGTNIITTNGITIPAQIVFNGIGGTWLLADNLICTGVDLELLNGTFNANNFNLTCNAFQSSNTNERNLILGSGTWTVTGIGTGWDLSITTGLTLDPGTSTIKMTANGTCTFQGGGLTYNNFWNDVADSQTCNMTGSNTFNDFKISTAPDIGQFFTATTITTVNTFTANGFPFYLTRINSTTGNTFNLVKAGGGIICCDFITINYSNASPNNTWYAGIHSIDMGINTGWLFSDCSTGINVPKNEIIFSIYPDPTSGQFTILLPTDNAEITVTNMIGQETLKMQATQKTINLHLDINGVYTVFVRTNQGTVIRKLIVNH